LLRGGGVAEAQISRRDVVEQRRLFYVEQAEIPLADVLCRLERRDGLGIARAADVAATESAVNVDQRRCELAFGLRDQGDRLEITRLRRVDVAELGVNPPEGRDVGGVRHIVRQLLLRGDQVLRRLQRALEFAPRYLRV